jgi:transcriptional regulator with XRE-family HTH domain
MDSTIGLRIRKVRVEKKLTQGEFANFMGIKQANLSHIENKGLKITIDILNKIISNFDIDANWLLTGKGEMHQNGQKIGDISNSTVVGANVNGHGICIHHSMSEETISEIAKNHNDIIKKQQEQIDSLIAVINKLSDKVT